MTEEQEEADEEGEAQQEGEEESDDSDEESVPGQAAAAAGGASGSAGRAKVSSVDEDGGSTSNNRCDLLWQGLLPKRVFTGFKFHESKTAYAAKKMLEAKNVGHYWDMLEKAEQSLASSQLLEF